VRRLNIGSPDANTRIDIPANAKRGSKAAPISPVALEAVKRIETLFDIEREINGLAAKQCLERRRKDSLPLVGGRSPTIYLIRKSGCQYEDNRQSGFHVHWCEGVQPKSGELRYLNKEVTRFSTATSTVTARQAFRFASITA
jgi:hypothetical protein